MATLQPVYSTCSQEIPDRFRAHFEYWGHVQDFAWRIEITCGRRSGVLPLVFGRKEDAELAIHGISGLDVWSTDDFEECRDRVGEFGRDRLMQMCVESLAW